MQNKSRFIFVCGQKFLRSEPQNGEKRGAMNQEGQLDTGITTLTSLNAYN